MSDRLTPEREADIRARANAATPGHWGSHRDLNGVYTIQARPRTTRYGMENDGDIATLAGRTDAYANASFIAYARNDVEALLAELAAVRAERDAYRERALDAENRSIVDGREVCADCGRPVPDGPCGVHSPDAVFQRAAREAAQLRAERDLAQRKVASLKAEQDRDDAEYAEVIAERDSAREALREACDQIAALESDLGGATARIAELEAERLTTNEALDDAVQELRRRSCAACGQLPAALVNPAVPNSSGTCRNCGSAPDQWCPDCAACERGCFDAFDGNACTHAQAKWGNAPKPTYTQTAEEASHG